MPHKGKLIIACVMLALVAGAYQLFGTAPEQAARSGLALIDAILSR